MEYILSFSGTTVAIHAEAILLSAGVTVRVMPLPSSISSGCGIALRIDGENLQKSLDIFRINQLVGYKVHIKNIDENSKVSYTLTVFP